MSINVKVVLWGVVGMFATIGFVAEDLSSSEFIRFVIGILLGCLAACGGLLYWDVNRRLRKAERRLKAGLDMFYTIARKLPSEAQDELDEMLRHLSESNGDGRWT